MDWFYNILKIIKNNPERIIGEANFTRLNYYLDGYVYREAQETTHQKIKWYQEFQNYVESYYQVDDTHTWPSIISFFTNTEKEAYDTFYQLLDEFKNSEYNHYLV